jgi:hypothetical protein
VGQPANCLALGYLSDTLAAEIFRPTGMSVRYFRVSWRLGRPEPYVPVAALNLTTSSAGIRPRSLTSMPWTLAHSRTSVVSSPVAKSEHRDHAVAPTWLN